MRWIADRGESAGRRPRVGIDGGCLSNRRGFGRFARQMVEALGASDSGYDFVVLVDRPSVDRVAIPPGMETVAVEVREAPSVAASSDGRRRLGDMLAMGRAASRAGLDAIYFPSTYSFFPVWNVGKVSVTMHDSLALAHPDWVFTNGKGRLAWWLKERLAVARADQVVTVSDSARRDLVEWFGLPEGRVVVVTEGPGEVFGPGGRDDASDRALRRHGVEPGSRFLLYVGGLSPHKNLPRLVEGLARVRGADDVRLVLVGDFGDVFHSSVDQIRATVRSLGLEGRVHLAGYVPDDDLVYLYRRAYALVQPSLMEGFGLPSVEAMACGTPVVCSRAGSLPEVVGDAGRYFDPLDVGEMAGAIEGLLLDPAARQTLASIAVARSRRFTWAEAARRLVEGFDRLGLRSARGRRSRRGRPAEARPVGEGSRRS